MKPTMTPFQAAAKRGFDATAHRRTMRETMRDNDKIREDRFSRGLEYRVQDIKTIMHEDRFGPRPNGTKKLPWRVMDGDLVNEFSGEIFIERVSTRTLNWLTEKGLTIGRK